MLFSLQKCGFYGLIKVPKKPIKSRIGALFMTYEELKKAYEEMSLKCSEIEKKVPAQ